MFEDQLVMKFIPLSNRKYGTLRYLTHELKSTVLGGTQTFIQKYKIVFLEKKKCSIKMLPQMVLQTENNIFLNLVSLVMLLMAPILGPSVKISSFS